MWDLSYRSVDPLKLISFSMFEDSSPFSFIVTPRKMFSMAFSVLGHERFALEL